MRKSVFEMEYLMDVRLARLLDSVKDLASVQLLDLLMDILMDRESDQLLECWSDQLSDCMHAN